MHSSNSSTVLRSEPAEVKRTIAIALDDSKLAQVTFDHAMANIIRPTDLVVLIHVQSNDASVILSGLHPLHDKAVADARRESAHALLKHHAARLSEAKIAFTALYLLGPIKEALVQKVNELKANTLVVGAGGIDSKRPAFLGSVADYCIHYSECPVLVVKPTSEQIKDLHLAPVQPPMNDAPTVLRMPM
ncbi:hypothetical protein CcCBS67573_g03564 [Chytriomyces confervae]|uniref:UspA domain-containing protein n=1 Tax=Chytriomyces confervae TaxID=246404 RepID=A0A507FGB2_9FUNG|nr:hypothetical protein HDU80_004557 [Chytriomyces hyalinus]TPX75172.1 hypothetical protein CcCBS67573_g03564 [Chytriomyces confervae]